MRAKKNRTYKHANNGDVYGRLTVTGQADPTFDGKRLVLCSCACGTLLHKVRVEALVGGTTTSCGCVRSEKAKERAALRSGKQVAA